MAARKMEAADQTDKQLPIGADLSAVGSSPFVTSLPGIPAPAGASVVPLRASPSPRRTDNLPASLPWGVGRAPFSMGGEPLLCWQVQLF
jgi:hypothetical protein